MPKRANSFVPKIFIVAFVFVAMIVAAGHSLVKAESTCIEQPNQVAPEGTRWTSRLDRAKGRKCWFLSDASANGHDAAAQGAAAPGQAGAPPAPTLSERLSSLFDSLTGASTSSPAPQAAAPQSSAANVQRRPPANAVARSEVRSESGVRVDQRSIGEAHAGARSSPGMTPSERTTLFEEFLRWKESQPIGGRPNAGAPSP